MGFSRQEYWGRLPFPFPGDLPGLGIELRSPALQEDAFAYTQYKYVYMDTGIYPYIHIHTYIHIYINTN